MRVKLSAKSLLGWWRDTPGALDHKRTNLSATFLFYLHPPPKNHKLKLVYLPADRTGCILFPHCTRYFHLQIQILDFTKSERSVEVNWDLGQAEIPVTVGMSAMFSLAMGGGPVPSMWFSSCNNRSKGWFFLASIYSESRML